MVHKNQSIKLKTWFTKINLSQLKHGSQNQSIKLKTWFTKINLSQLKIWVKKINQAKIGAPSKYLILIRKKLVQ